ncbi:MAG: hypothetical protein KAJ49_06145 [Arcobacteraceae bacterium]|nr:hypothetical protein [Arcobacteraceae bacterium]
MNKITKIVIIGLLVLGRLNANELLFDLKAQDFSKTFTESMTNAKYKVSDKIIVETNLLKRSMGYYRANVGFSGFLNLFVTTNSNNWKFNMDVVYDDYKDRLNKIRLLKFTDNSGEVITLEFANTYITINSKKFMINIIDKQLDIGIKMKNSNLIVSINGKIIYKMIVEFDKLDFVSSSFFTYDTANYYSAYDQLNGITLYEND